MRDRFTPLLLMHASSFFALLERCIPTKKKTFLSHIPSTFCRCLRNERAAARETLRPLLLHAYPPGLARLRNALKTSEPLCLPLPVSSFHAHLLSSSPPLTSEIYVEPKHGCQITIQPLFLWLPDCAEEVLISTPSFLGIAPEFDVPNKGDMESSVAGPRKIDGLDNLG